MSFYHKFWDLLTVDIMAFMKEFHSRGRLSKSIDASFIALIPKKTGADSIKDFRPISLLGSISKILAKVLAPDSKRSSLPSSLLLKVPLSKVDRS